MPCRPGRRRWPIVVYSPMSGRPPTRCAHPAGQARPIPQTALHGYRTNFPILVPGRRSLKDRRSPRDRIQNRRHRLPASNSCLHPVGPVALPDGSGGHRAREIHASNFSEIERSFASILGIVQGSFGLRRVPLTNFTIHPTACQPPSKEAACISAGCLQQIHVLMEDQLRRSLRKATGSWKPRSIRWSARTSKLSSRSRKLMPSRLVFI